MDDFTFNALAPSPDGSARMIELTVDAERVRQLAGLRRKTPLYELTYNVMGQLPPVNNIGYHEQDIFPDHWGGVRRAHTIFKGLRRPMNDHDLDGNVYVYVMSPPYTYRYIAHMACTAKRYDAPVNTVFAVYVIFDDNNFDKGFIVNWEWIGADPDNPKLPRDHTERYEQQVWTNG